MNLSILFTLSGEDSNLDYLIQSQASYQVRRPENRPRPPGVWVSEPHWPRQAAKLVIHRHTEQLGHKALTDGIVLAHLQAPRPTSPRLRILSLAIPRWVRAA